MKELKQHIFEKLKVTNKNLEWTKTVVPELTFKTLSDFGELFIKKLGDKTELPIDDIYEYLDIAIPESI